jgi:hypothetical protein
MRRTWVVVLAALLGVTIAPPPAVAAPPVTNPTMYATRGDPSWSQLFRLTVDRSGTVVARHAVAPDGDRFEQATDVTRSGLIHVRHAPDWPQNRLQVRPRAGGAPLEMIGTDAVFAPGGKAVLAMERAPDLDAEGNPGPWYDVLVVNRVDGTGSRGIFWATGFSIRDYRYSPDAASIWISAARTARWPEGLVQDDRATADVVRTIPIAGCGDFEFVPSGRHVVFACGSELRVVALADGRVTAHFPLPAGRFADRIEGRLAPRVLLVSAHSRNARGQELPWLGALDLRTFSVRPLARSSGFHSAAAAY